MLENVLMVSYNDNCMNSQLANKVSRVSIRVVDFEWLKFSDRLFTMG